MIAPTVFAYLLVIKSMDRFEPEPLWLLGMAFAWGAVVSTLLAILGNALGESALSAALGSGRGDALLQASTASFVAPLVEETTKGLGLLVLWALSALFLNEIDGALDGAIYGGVVGLGFTLTEDVLYVSSAGSQGGAAAFFGTFVLRTVVSGLGHASFTAMTGLGIGVAAESRSGLMKLIAPVGGWCAAVGLHFLHNFLVTFLYDGGTGLVVKLLAFWLFDALFFVVIVVLALRDRAIVLRGLMEEAGRLLHPKELARTTSHWMLLPLWNFFTLSGGQSGYRRARRKQLDLIELSFLKQRRARGQSGADLTRREHELRSRIHTANQAGVFIGPR
ncbi:MAG TPA: PrsW family intramembrane metalloprotease [Polyangiaceae bacterium]|nr:PrsW family intramembrane metalloprotease [Polyangiaceae bacterium]